MTIDTRRRRLLLGTAGAALTALLPLPLYAEREIGVDAFLALSQKLTEKPELDHSLAAAYLKAFKALGKGPALADLADAHPNAADKALAEAVIGAWYTGLISVDSGLRLVTYDDALLWQSMDYTKPPGFCDSFGAWAKAPAG